MDAFALPDPDALPTCRPFVGRTFVVRVDDAAADSSTFVSDIVFMHRIGVRPLLVHDALARPAAQRLVGDINRIGGEAVGLDGTSASMLTLAIGADGAAQLRGINSSLLELLLDRGYIPVLASQGAGLSGTAMPLDADETARGLAAAVHAIRLLFGSQPGGVPSDASGIIPELTSSEALDLAGSGLLSGELAHRLMSAALGVRAGVEEAQLLDLSSAHATIVEMLTAQHVGTRIVSNVLLS